MPKIANSVLDAQSATLVDWAPQPDGSIKVFWEDGHSNHFPDLQAIYDYIATLGADGTVSERFILAWFLARQPDAANVNIVEGKRLTLDLSAASPIRVQ